jgi:hypothetical protein
MRGEGLPPDLFDDRPVIGIWVLAETVQAGERQKPADGHPV